MPQVQVRISPLNRMDILDRTYGPPHTKTMKIRDIVLLCSLVQAGTLSVYAQPTNGVSQAHQKILQGIHIERFPSIEGTSIPKWVQTKSIENHNPLNVVVVRTLQEYAAKPVEKKEMDPFGGLGGGIKHSKIPPIGGIHNLRNISGLDALETYIQLQDLTMWSESNLLLIAPDTKPVLGSVPLPPATKVRLQSVHVRRLHFEGAPLKDGIEELSRLLSEGNVPGGIELSRDIPKERLDHDRIDLRLFQVNLYECLQIICALHQLEPVVEPNGMIRLQLSPEALEKGFKQQKKEPAPPASPSLP